MDLVEQGGDADGNLVDFQSGLPTQGQLPLARIKKVMKSDDQVKMISAEAPILFARACEIFISDLTCRAFLIAEEHKRRTIQRSDIAGAIGRSDLFDFLIDIVPRHESVPSSRLPGGGAAKREKTGEGKGVGRSTAGASGSRRQQQDEAVAHDDHFLPGMANSYGDADASSSAVATADEATAAAAGTSSDSFHIPHAGGAHIDVGGTPMTHWIHDTSADEHSSQPDIASSHAHHPSHSHHQAQYQHGSHPAHEHPQPHHHGAHHHHGPHHASGHHSHHHSPLDYVASSSNAGTPNSIGAGSANGGAGWPHTFSGF